MSKMDSTSFMASSAERSIKIVLHFCRWAFPLWSTGRTWNPRALNSADRFALPAQSSTMTSSDTDTFVDSFINFALRASTLSNCSCESPEALFKPVRKGGGNGGKTLAICIGDSEACGANCLYTGGGLGNRGTSVLLWDTGPLGRSSAIGDEASTILPILSETLEAKATAVGPKLLAFPSRVSDPQDKWLGQS